MIRKASQMKRTTRENMRGGKGTIEFLHFFEKDELASPTRLLARLTLRPGDSIGLHRHENEEEIFVIQKGTAELDEGTGRQRVGPGDAILTGSGEEHAIANVGEDDLEIIAIIVQFPA
ncbi:MAG: cupin domain-containing protein [Planctomycetes bacterium]|nr:cupin domain-containing protein [Planctomycetota bacterium]